MARPSIRRCVQLGHGGARARHPRHRHRGEPRRPRPAGPEIAALCDTTLAKFHFSAPAEEGFLRRLPAGRDTLVVAGCEAHVCVMQTVAGLLEAGHAVKWVADAVGSRHPHDRLAATERARKLRRRRRHDRDGRSSKWLGTSEHPKFKRLSQLIR